jgi:hypothetical protein
MAILDLDLSSLAGHVSIRKGDLTMAPTDSWWATAPREGFSRAFRSQSRRESRKGDTSFVLEAPVQPAGRPKGAKSQPKFQPCRSQCGRLLTATDARRGCVRCFYCREKAA